jgi:hypothetical protein
VSVRSIKMHKIEGVFKLGRSTVLNVCTIEWRNVYTKFRALITRTSSFNLRDDKEETI